MSSSEIKTLLENLCREMERLWVLTGYRSNSFPLSKPIVTTIKASEAVVLPKTGRPIRGIGGQGVSKGETDYQDRSIIVNELVYGSILPRSSHHGKEETEARERMNLQGEALFSLFNRVPNLVERILEAIGFKHFDPEELTDWIKSRNPEEFRVEKALFISRILSDELVSAGFDPGQKAPFDKWDEVLSRATDRIFSVATRESNEYEVVIFLNAPMIDEESPVPLVKFALNDDLEVDLSIGYATDELLTRLFRTGSIAQLSEINTVIRFPISVSVSAPVESYLNVYLIGAAVAERVVDCLRMIRDDDIGVMALEVFRTGPYIPAIRKTYEAFYQSEHAPFIPKRFSFEIAETPPLTEEELSKLRELLSSYADIKSTKGLEVAIQRFRSSCERYQPPDPERLLDMAFSFEAIFLNDGENKELSYRLSLRAARFLGQTPEERETIFQSVKNLYDIRSKIAHGETLDTMKQGDKEKLQRVLSRAPRILKNALMSMMLGNGPKGLEKNELLGKWWRKLELK